MTDLPALREAVAETVPYCGQGETVPNAWARRERAERILLDAVPALLDELEAARSHYTDIAELWSRRCRKGGKLGTDAGICGVFGIVPRAYPAVAPLYTELVETLNRLCDETTGHPDEMENHESVVAFVPRFCAAFAEIGIVLPEGVALLWSGSSDDRPARCETPAEEFLLGFGILTKPWEYPPMDESFRKEAQFHTWVWMG